MSSINKKNHEIRAKTIRLVDDDGTRIISLTEALNLAEDNGLDLVQIAESDIPVCRILDWNKHLYQQRKMKKDVARKQRQMTGTIKEIQLRPTTDTHDITIKGRRAKEFLEQSYRVRAVIRFRGRENRHRENGHQVMEQFLEHLGSYKLDRPLQDSGNEISIVVAPGDGLGRK